MSQYIPDITERFPEGMDGVDMTDSFFGGGYYDSGREYSEMYETNAIIDSTYHDEDCGEMSYNDMLEEVLTGKSISSERMRLVTDSGYPFWDLSYWHVRIDGDRYRIIDSPFERLPKKTYKQDIYKEAKKCGIYIPHLFDSISTLR
jgi:hypothetical protein